MWHGMRRRALAGIVVLAGVAALAPAAGAAITPSASTSTATPLTAGATGNLDLDLKFAPSQSAGTYNDSPKNLTINLPPGVLANAAIAGGSCLTAVQINDPSPCQVGSGNITAYVLGFIPITVSVNFYLVPPPAAGDLAGLAVASGGTQVGSTGDVKIRPSGDPDGVGVTIGLVLPNTQAGMSIDITEIDSTFTGLRFPTTCPSTPAPISLAETSYADPTTKTTSLPISVGGCAALPYAPKFSITTTRDRSDAQVAIATTITQAANESPNSSVALAFPIDNLKPALGGLKNLCTNPASGTCTPVASATAASPLYPTPLTGVGYLTGSLSGLQLTLVFPAPFPLTLTGSVNLKTNITSFSGLPDIPLTSLKVDVNGGPSGLFTGACSNPSGTASAALTDQNGDKSAKVPGQFTITGCPSSSGGSGGTSGGSGGSGGSSSGSSSAAKPHVTSTKVSGLKTGKPSLTFKVTAGRKEAKLRTLTVELPKGLSIVRHRVHRKLKVTGVSLKGAKLKSAAVSKGHLVITLKTTVKSVTVTVRSSALRESAALTKKARATAKKARLKSLRLTVIAKDAKGKRTTIRVSVKHLGL